MIPNNISILELQKIHMYYKTIINEKNHILKDISLTINNGETLIILGPSGSGKSTLLNIIAGLENPSSGNIKIQGTDLSTCTIDQKDILRRDKIGIVFQFFELYEDLSCRENIELALVIGEKYRKETTARAKHLLAAVGLEHKENVIVSNLSRGEKQRVAIARAMANDPIILLADEPTGALDEITSKNIMELLRNLNTSDKTLIIATHDHTIIEPGDKIVRLKDGTIIEIKNEKN